MNATTRSYAQLLFYMRDECRQAGSIKAWARKHRISFGYAAAVLRGDAKPGKKILKALKVKKQYIWLAKGEIIPGPTMRFEDI